MTRHLHCIACNTPLSGGLDTYGNPGAELCWSCFGYEDMDETEMWCPVCDHGALYTRGVVNEEFGIPDDQPCFCRHCGRVFDSIQLAKDSWQWGYIITSHEELASMHTPPPTVSRKGGRG